MSVWYCPAHGVYGGQVTCPKCGFQGFYTTVEREEPMNDQTITLLRKSAIQFRHYAQEHLKKSEDASDIKQRDASRIKSAINLSLAEQIEDHLRTIHNLTHPLSPVEQPLTPETMTKEDWQRTYGS